MGENTFAFYFAFLTHNEEKLKINDMLYYKNNGNLFSVNKSNEMLAE